MLSLCVFVRGFTDGCGCFVLPFAGGLGISVCDITVSKVRMVLSL